VKTVSASIAITTSNSVAWKNLGTAGQITKVEAAHLRQKVAAGLVSDTKSSSIPVINEHRSYFCDHDLDAFSAMALTRDTIGRRYAVSNVDGF
jgi:hypothetical protein